MGIRLEKDGTVQKSIPYVGSGQPGRGWYARHMMTLAKNGEDESVIRGAIGEEGTSETVVLQDVCSQRQNVDNIK